MFAKYVCFFLLGLQSTSSNIIQTTNFDDSLIVQSSGDEWWKTATIYQIYPRSFKDSNNDGIGDLKGIIEKIDYINGLGVQAIWLSPIFDSPQKDNGYDIQDYMNIWPTFGTMDDFKKLIKKAHDLGLKIIIDFVPNHTSDLHQWFRKSIKNDTTYGDYYVWRNCEVDKLGNVKPPNNWLSVFGGSAWSYDSTRKQCYLHQFLDSQPDLNYWNPNVTKEMKDILNFWLNETSADGVRIDAVSFLMEDQKFTDEPPRNGTKTTDTYESLDHIRTKDQPETFMKIEEFRRHLTQISKSSSSKKIAFTEAENIKYYGDGSNGFSFNFVFLDLSQTSTAMDINKKIKEYIDKLSRAGKNLIPNWVLGNHDTHRIASKVGSEKVDGLNMLTGFLPGIQVTYQGEELGMTDGSFDKSQGNDQTNNPAYVNVTRDFERTPFQWSGEKNAGFNKGNSTWLPIASDYKTVNVLAEEKSSSSHLSIYRDIQKWRNKTRSNIRNSVEILSHSTNNCVHIRRKSPGIAYEYLFNMENKKLNVTLNSKDNITVEVSSKKDRKSPLIGTFTLEPYESMIVSYEFSSASGLTFSLGLLLGLNLIIRI